MKAWVAPDQCTEEYVRTTHVAIQVILEDRAIQVEQKTALRVLDDLQVGDAVKEVLSGDIWESNI